MDRMSYHVYEMLHLAFAPARAATDALLHTLKSPLNPLHHTAFGRSLAASAELFERMTRRYGKPMFALDTTTVDGVEVEVAEEHVWLKPFCGLLHFKRPVRGRGAAAIQAADRRAHVGPLRHAAARDGGSLSAEP